MVNDSDKLVESLMYATAQFESLGSRRDLPPPLIVSLLSPPHDSTDSAGFLQAREMDGSADIGWPLLVPQTGPLQASAPRCMSPAERSTILATNGPSERDPPSR